MDKRRVLIVEDSPTRRQLLVFALRRLRDVEIVEDEEVERDQLFELANLVADRTLGNEQLARGEAEAQLARGSFENLECIQ